jgi:hypothetical protein
MSQWPAVCWIIFLMLSPLLLMFLASVMSSIIRDSQSIGPSTYRPIMLTALCVILLIVGGLILTAFDILQR